MPPGINRGKKDHGLDDRIWKYGILHRQASTTGWDGGSLWNAHIQNRVGVVTDGVAIDYLYSPRIATTASNAKEPKLDSRQTRLGAQEISKDQSNAAPVIAGARSLSLVILNEIRSQMFNGGDKVF